MSPKAPQTLIARIVEYDVSNVHIGGKIIFIPPEKRESTRTEHPPGKIVKVISENGTLKEIDRARGEELDKFLKEEETRRSGQSTTAAEKIRSGTSKKEKAKEATQTAAGPSPEPNSLAMPITSKIAIDPTIINDSFCELPPVAEPLQCGLSGPCIKSRCRKLATCWTAEINAMRGHGLHHAANTLENQLKEILGE